MRLIDEKKYVKKSYLRKMAMCEPQYTMETEKDVETLMRLIEDAPLVDVAPVRHGWWNNGDPYCPICRKDKFRGLDADVWADWQPDYCPNCGAKMDGGVKK